MIIREGEAYPPLLQWEAVGELGEDEYYNVTIYRPWQGQPYFAGSDWTKDTEFIPNYDVVINTSDKDNLYSWSVTVMRLTEEVEGEGKKGVPISPPSETRSFYWHE